MKTTSGASTPGRVQLCSPTGHLGPQPKLDATLSEIDGRPWHIFVAPLVLANGVAMSEMQDVSDALRIDEIVDRHALGHRV